MGQAGAVGVPVNALYLNPTAGRLAYTLTKLEKFRFPIQRHEYECVVIGETGGFKMKKTINNLTPVWKLASWHVISTQRDLHEIITKVLLFLLT